jgi:hypothetical protein
MLTLSETEFFGTGGAGENGEALAYSVISSWLFGGIAR